MPEGEVAGPSDEHVEAWRRWVDANVPVPEQRAAALAAALQAAQRGAPREQAAQFALQAAHQGRRSIPGTRAAIGGMVAFVLVLFLLRAGPPGLVVAASGVVLGFIAAIKERPVWGSIAIGLNGLALLTALRLMLLT